MSLPKKGFRKIIIDGNEFLWKVRKKINWNEIHDGQLGIPVQNKDGGQLLILTIGYSRSYFTEKNEFQITLSIIEICIKEAIKNGWNHKSIGPKFEFDCTRLVMSYLSNRTSKT